MADFSKFRTSFAGFNREDVVNFIEKNSFEHQNEIRSLKKELEQLKTEKQNADAALAQSNETIENLKKLLEANKDPAILEADLPSEELEAYRRAEAAERTAKERAESLKLQIQVLCNTTESDFSASEEMIKASIESVDASLAQLHTTLGKLKTVFSDAQSALNEIKI